MSTHEVRIVRLPEIQNHPDADRLGLVDIMGYTVVVGKDQWKEGDLAAYIEPDYTVPVEKEEFSFLKKYEDRKRERIKVKKLRGIYSQGLLVPAPIGVQEGDDVMEMLGVERYVPSIEEGSTRGNSEGGPSFNCPKYDLENFKKYKRVFIDDEEVCITEKIHGANARYLWHQDRMWCGTRTRWVLNDSNIWWQALEQNPWLEKFCKENSDMVLYGEVFGSVQDMKYGHGPGKYSVAVFDILYSGRWLDWMDVLNFKDQIQLVPILYHGPYSESLVVKYTDGKTHWEMKNPHIREGCVVKPVRERLNARLGRVIAKNVSNDYLAKSKD